MLRVIYTTWPLLLGVLLLMVGNGVQGTLLGIRGTLESFGPFQLSVVMSAYFAGFLLGSRLVPEMLRHVGHIRVFAALGSLISAILVLYPLLLDWQVWALMRIVIGFGFSGIYITAESWLNSISTNENRGQALSAYMIVQMVGIVTAQGLIAYGDPLGYDLFIIPSVMVSFAFLPLLLATFPTPSFESGERLGFRELYKISPLGCVGMFLIGGIFSSMFGMASVWGTLSLLTVKEIALFSSALYIGGLIMQYPIGKLSDRVDRRKVMLWLSVIAALVMLVATVFSLPFWALLIVAALLGGITYPVYGLLIAYTNDYLSKEQMAAASAGLLFINGIGSIFGPLITGWMMGVIGTRSFFLFNGALYAMLAGYAAWRMTRRATPLATGVFVRLSPTASAVASVAVVESAAEINPSPENPEAAAEAAEALIIQPREAAAPGDVPAPEEKAGRPDGEGEARPPQG
ncbi:MFS transporter [Pseudogemmobacter faecipullorum]|uniref:MFS transporter n=1 Tax=Pseudogemmobacter faecipullorum TaxID=2755041 RepID=A0ABS8CJ02_9RHOB|nr:MFS transporter [Pseudogemmobacter faecipullorum]MCB5409377.1 MFS transporter [Pseudogemmobacter faecipullorum]